MSSHNAVIYIELCTKNTLLQKAQARWAGHVLLMEDKRILKLIFYEELVEGRRQVGRPKFRFKDNLKTTLKSLEVSTETWETLASDRPTWRSLISKGAKSAEQRCKAAAESNRAARKARAASSSSQPPAGPKCATCGRQFCAKIGLISHPRIHLTNLYWSRGHHRGHQRWMNIIIIMYQKGIMNTYVHTCIHTHIHTHIHNKKMNFLL